MGLFAKNRPTKRIELGTGDWVELQLLSKGIKDDLKSEVMALLKDFQIDINASNGQLTPKSGLSISGEFLQKTKEVEYKQIVAAIAKWSEDAEINVENIKALSDEAYDKILEEIAKMNELSEEERKN
jgi:hypothetical protein